MLGEILIQNTEDCNYGVKMGGEKLALLRSFLSPEERSRVTDLYLILTCELSIDDVQRRTFAIQIAFWKIGRHFK